MPTCTLESSGGKMQLINNSTWLKGGARLTMQSGQRLVVRECSTSK